MHQVEFYRDAYVSASIEKGEITITTMPRAANSKKTHVFCSCSPGSYANCTHAESIVEQSEHCRKHFNTSSPWDAFGKSVFAKIMDPMQKSCPLSLKGLRLTQSGGKGVVSGPNNVPVVWFNSRPKPQRFLSRIGLDSGKFPRSDWIDRLDSFVMTEQEKLLRERGHATTRMSMEKSVWIRIAYHLYRELTGGKWSVRMRYSLSRECMILEWYKGPGTLLFQTMVVSGCERETAGFLTTLPNGSTDFHQAGQEAEILFRTKQNGRDSVTVTPVLVEQTNTPEINYELVPAAVFGDSVYIQQRSSLFPISAAGRKIIARHWTGPRDFSIHEFSSLLEQDPGLFSFGNEQDLFAVSSAETFDRLIGMPLKTKVDKLEVRAGRIEDCNCEAEVLCCFGASVVNLGDILTARRNGRRYIPRGDGLIDCAAPGVVEITTGITGRKKKNSESAFLSVSRAELLRLKAVSGGRITVAGSDEMSVTLNRLFELTPAAGFQNLKTLRSKLRPYQKVAVQWLLFLWDNFLGGILADEMGLGKTHQAMGLITALREQRSRNRPVLVICPTTVMSHWENLTSQFAPNLKVELLHGSTRDTRCALRNADVLVTSYGILRNDVDILSEQTFDLVIFDEIQVLKNRGSKSCHAASSLKTRSAVGLTGTPIQNTPEDLKTIFDIVLPGYLGGHEMFKKEFLEPIAQGNEESLATLRKLVRPFILRRLKKAVITDLPPKIEDIRTCRLEPEQRMMYDEAIRTKGASLLNALHTANEDIPYIHIFALLGYLKQICNHPVLLQEKEAVETDYTSGKWELFKEILFECIESEEKVVVYTQYLGMMDLMERHLEKEGIAHVSLRGSSRNRGAIVEKFQNDPNCKVFVGSVRAAGVGIDLTAADVVIHYDRWWNAATEDQATDRVHRIGQTKTVQVIKLVTRGTLEDRIDRIISVKRQLSEDVLPEDKPDALKHFTREELTELLQVVRD